MFSATMSVPYNYGYVEKANVNPNYYEILKNIMLSSNKNNNTDNNIIRDNYIMQNNQIIKSFSELYDIENDRAIKLLKSIDFVISSDEEGFYYTNQKYNLYVYGENQEDAENSIYSELLFQYNSYVFEDDDKLDTNARKLKYDLLSVIDLNA